MNLDCLLEQIKNKGAKITKTRRGVLNIFLFNNKPLSASEIKKYLLKAELNVNRSTIYRELKSLIKMNIIKELKILNSTTLFELALGHNHHLICLKCHNIENISMKNHLEEEEKNIMKKNNFKILQHSLEFYGLCDKCK